MQGRVEDPPWGRTLAALAQRHATGILVLHPDHGPAGFQITLEAGFIVDARSPLEVDDAAGVAATSQLIPAEDLESIRQSVAAAPQDDDIDVVADTAGLSVNQAQRLRRRTLAQRAVRTFALESGAFQVLATPARRPPVAIDIHPVVYLGALVQVSAERLRKSLDQLGTFFRLTGDAAGTLARFGFTAVETPILEGMSNGTTTGELVKAMRAREAHDVLAVLYALACCHACEISRHAFAAVVGDRVRSRVDSNVSFRTNKMPKLQRPSQAAMPPPTPPATPPPTPSRKKGASARPPATESARKRGTASRPPTEPARKRKITPQPLEESISRPSGMFDLGAALSADLGDEALAFEVEPSPPVAVAPVTDGSQDARRISRSIKRTEQLLAFVAVPRRPSKRR